MYPSGHRARNEKLIEIIEMLRPKVFSELSAICYLTRQPEGCVERFYCIFATMFNACFCGNGENYCFDLYVPLIIFDVNLGECKDV